MVPVKKLVEKGGKKKKKKKKQVLKCTLDCTHPVEDGIMDAANFVSDILLGLCSGGGGGSCPAFVACWAVPTFSFNQSQGRLSICCCIS